MATDLVSIQLVIPDYLERFKRNFPRIVQAIAADIQTNRGLLFDNEGAYSGHSKWKDLASGLNRKVAKNGLQSRQILRKSGALKNSIGPQNPTGAPGPNGSVTYGGDYRQPIVKVGTSLKYAKILNDGGTIKHPGTKNGFGRGIKIKPHDIKIPPRNFTDWNSTDGNNMKIMLKNLVDVLNGR